MDEKEIRLAKRAAAGNREAYGVLVTHYQVYLYKTAYMYLKHEQDSLDAVQECVVKGMLSVEKLREPAFFKTWITRILINCIYESREKIPNIVPFEEYQESGIRDCLIEEKIDLYDAIDTLKDNYKMVVILFYFQELKIKDIARIMEIPEGSVKVYLMRAKKELKEILVKKEDNLYAK